MQKALAPDISTWPGANPQLIGSRCGDCGATTFPCSGGVRWPVRRREIAIAVLRVRASTPSAMLTIARSIANVVWSACRLPERKRHRLLRRDRGEDRLPYGELHFNCVGDGHTPYPVAAHRIRVRRAIPPLSSFAGNRIDAACQLPPGWHDYA